MNPELHHLIITYGYWLMAFGAIIEGETFLIAGGIAAQQGILHLPGLIALAVVGSCLHDWALFFLGRYCGSHYLKNKPQFHAKADGILKLLDRYGVLVVIGLRFAYGLRTIIPTVLGISPISNRKFLIFDFIGGIIWAALFILGGYFLGEAFEHFLKILFHYEDWAFHIVTALVIIGLLGFAAFWWLKNKR